MESFRMKQVDGEFQKAIAEIIRNKLKAPELDGLIISVMSVDTAKDLSLSKVGISVLGSDNLCDMVVAKLNQSKNYIRRELMRMVRIKTTPELTFFVDRSYEKGQHLMDLIDKVAKQDKGEN